MVRTVRAGGFVRFTRGEIGVIASGKLAAPERAEPMRDGAGVVREHLSSLWRVGWVRGHRAMSAMLPSRREPPSGNAVKHFTQLVYQQGCCAPFPSVLPWP
jgi:hypothetical protein